MDPITLSLILMGVGGAIKGGTQLFQGLSNKGQAKKLEQAAGKRPDYTIPESVDKMIGMYGQMAQSGLPGEDIARQDIQASTARTVGQASQLADSPVAALTALGGAQSRELSALRDLQMRAAQYQAQARQNYASAIGKRADFETEQWRQNELLPWEIDMNRAMQLRTQGAGNIMGAADSFGSTLAQMGGFAGQMSMYNNMYPNYGSATQSQGAFVGPPEYNYTDPFNGNPPWDYRNQPYK